MRGYDGRMKVAEIRRWRILAGDGRASFWLTVLLLTGGFVLVTALAA